jgi:hypothetical protein
MHQLFAGMRTFENGLDYRYYYHHIHRVDDSSKLPIQSVLFKILIY